jgi:hypothetical protein
MSLYDSYTNCPEAQRIRSEGCALKNYAQIKARKGPVEPLPLWGGQESFFMRSCNGLSPLPPPASLQHTLDPSPVSVDLMGRPSISTLAGSPSFQPSCWEADTVTQIRNHRKIFSIVFFKKIKDTNLEFCQGDSKIVHEKGHLGH